MAVYRAFRRAVALLFPPGMQRRVCVDHLVVFRVRLLLFGRQPIADYALLCQQGRLTSR